MAMTITAATWAANQATFTTSAAHGINPGTQVSISGVTPAGYNGVFTALAGTTGSTIVVAMPVNPGTYSSGGTFTTDAFAAYPQLRTGLVGVAKDGSLWYTKGSTITQVAPPGTVVHPDAAEELQAPDASAAEHSRFQHAEQEEAEQDEAADANDDDEDEDETPTRRSHTHHAHPRKKK